MKSASELAKELEQGVYDEQLVDLYVDRRLLAYQKKRYEKALVSFIRQFGDHDVSVFSAPGRSEIGGNHTDHQHGEVLAASINLDAIAIVEKTENGMIRVISDGYDLISIDTAELAKKDGETGTTAALIRGVAAGMATGAVSGAASEVSAASAKYQVGGFNAYITSDVLIGAGLSSSAAFETIIGTILSYLYNGGAVSAVTIAMIGQYAENEYFGKPCGLMDQMACSVGNLVHIDFADPAHPIVDKIDFDMAKSGYHLCITDTKGSHADLTDDYAAVPAEMFAVAGLCGKECLRELTEEDILKNLSKIRSDLGDRFLLRALHFFEEDKRVEKQTLALKSADLPSFLTAIKESGDSSFKYLQNVYTSKDIQSQGLSVALMLSDILLEGHGASRVHGGGFAGTIQAFVPTDLVDKYQKGMDEAFGKGACHILSIRKYGGVQIL